MSTDVSIHEPSERSDPAPEPPTVAKKRKGDREISLLDLFIILAERNRFILLVAIVFAVLAIIVSLVLPERYTATVILLPPQQNSSLSAALSFPAVEVWAVSELLPAAVSASRTATRCLLEC